MSKRIYLAGPDVFLPDPDEAFRQKKAICTEHGFAGVSPLDNTIDLEKLPLREAGLQIAQANESTMQSCDAVIAQITPFRSPSADPGTTYEMGYMAALGRPVLAYTNVGGNFFERTSEYLGPDLRQREDQKSHEDSDRMLLEDFGLVDNLMLEGAVNHCGTEIIVVAADAEKRFTELSGFAECVRRLGEIFARP
jgi:nucleoside 2-deoxyribosyltransferase